MQPEEDPAVQKRALRRALRQMRRDRRLTQAEVAEEMDWHPSKVMRMEQGDVMISIPDLRALLGYYNITEESRVDELVRVARIARKRSPLDAYSDLFSKAYQTYLAHERSTTYIRNFELNLIPGLLQTREYASAVVPVFENDNHPPEREDLKRFDRIVQSRFLRQDLLRRENPPMMEFVVDESAIRRPIGGSSAMAAQLRHLKELGSNSHIRIQVLPIALGANPGLAGSFVLLEFGSREEPENQDADEPLLYTESVQGSVATKEDYRRTDFYMDRFTRLQKMALNVTDSNQMLDLAIRNFENSAI